MLVCTIRPAAHNIPFILFALFCLRLRHKFPFGVLDWLRHSPSPRRPTRPFDVCQESIVFGLFHNRRTPIQSGRCFCFRWLRVISVCDSIIQFARLYCRLIVYFSNQHSFIEFAGKAQHQFEGSWPAATVLVASSTRLDCSSRCKDGRTL